MDERGRLPDASGQLRLKGIFLRDYCVALYRSGATTIRIEKNTQRISAAWRTSVDFSILPTCVVLSLWDEKREQSYNIVGRIPPEEINFSTVTLLSSLSWRIHENRTDVGEARKEMERILSIPRTNAWTVAALASAANASFCALFGGDAPAMGIVFCATFLGFVLKQQASSVLGIDYRICIILSACLSAIISCSGFAFGWGRTPEVALATSVLYFVPGIPFSDAICDLIYGHYVCAASRFLHAVIITVCLSLGLCLAFLILNLKFL